MYNYVAHQLSLHNRHKYGTKIAGRWIPYLKITKSGEKLLSEDSIVDHYPHNSVFTELHEIL